MIYEKDQASVLVQARNKRSQKIWGSHPRCQQLLSTVNAWCQGSRKDTGRYFRLSRFCLKHKSPPTDHMAMDPYVVPLPGCPQAGSRMHSRSMSMAVLSSLLSSKSLSHICIRGTTSYTTCDANLRRRRRTILPRSVATADSDHVVGSLVLLRGSCS